MPEIETDQIRRTLDDHWFYDDTDTCECGYWAHFDSVRRHHIEDMLVAALSTPTSTPEERVLDLVCHCDRTESALIECPVHPSEIHSSPASKTAEDA